MSDKVLKAKNLAVVFKSRERQVHAVRGVDIEVNESEIVGIVGESGSGKSVAMKAVIGILPDNASLSADILLLGDKNLNKLSEKEYQKVRGRDITMIFQDPMTALNPVIRVGRQLEEVIIRNSGLSKKEAREKALEIFERVGIPSPKESIKRYPHEFSGGMRQRVLIAMALSCNPKLLIADEPTTALDVTIQAQILDLIKNMSKDIKTSVILITHDLGVVAETCDRVVIMYGGLVMETGNIEEIFYSPRHPYTMALLQAIPSIDMDEDERLKSIEGFPPSLTDPPKGCPFAERCEFRMDICDSKRPPVSAFSDTHSAMCFLNEEETENAFRRQKYGK